MKRHFNFFFNAELAIQREDKKYSDENLQKRLNVRSDFDQLCATDPERAQKVLQHPTVQLARKKFEKSYKRKRSQRKASK